MGAGWLPARRNLDAALSEPQSDETALPQIWARAVFVCFYGHFRTVATCGGDGEDRDPSRERTRVQEVDIQMTGLVMNCLTSHGECNGRFDGASPGAIMKKVYLLIAALTALVLAAVPAPASAATTTSTVVIHGQTFTEFVDRFPALGPVMNRVGGIEKTMQTIADYREREAFLSHHAA